MFSWFSNFFLSYDFEVHYFEHKFEPLYFSYLHVDLFYTNFFNGGRRSAEGREEQEEDFEVYIADDTREGHRFMWKYWLFHICNNLIVVDVTK